MSSNLTLLVGLFIAILAVGSCQPAPPKDYKKTCGINLVLENTIRRRLKEIPYSAETQVCHIIDDKTSFDRKLNLVDVTNDFNDMSLHSKI